MIVVLVAGFLGN